MRITALLKKLRELDVEKLGLESLRELEDEAVELNRQQLLSGKTSKGQELPPYSPASVERFGKRPGPWQLKDTGAFHESIFMGAERFPVFFDATDSKTELILEKLEKRGYDSVQIFGLNDENLERIAGKVKHILSRKIRSVLDV